jgi:predicted nucleotidyltransferase
MSKKLARQDILERLKGELPYLQEKYGVKRIALYGSFARSEQAEKSDVDLLVELARPLGFEFVDLADYLEKVLGRKVDLATFSTFQHSKQDPRRRHIAFKVEKDLVYVQ